MLVTPMRTDRERYAVALYRVSTAEQGHSGLDWRSSKLLSGPSWRRKGGRWLQSFRTSPAAKMTIAQVSRRLSPGAASLAQC